MQGVFAYALTYSPPVIMGRKMREFSCWHGLLLEAMDNPVLLLEPAPLDAVISAAWICGLSFSDGFAKAIDIRAIRKWARTRRRQNDAGAAVAMCDYIQAGLRSPEYWRENSTQKMNAPLWWHLALFAQEKMRMTEAEAWDCAVVKLNCYRACWAETQGWKGLKSTNELIASELAKAKANGGNG